jgi:hypothetical protein
MPDPVPHVPQNERDQLKLFVRAVYDMADSRFIKKVQVQDHSVKMERLESGEYKITSPDYDWEDFRSFLTTFRQVAMSDREAVYLPTIRNIVSRYGSDQLRLELKKLKQHVVPIIEGRLSGIRFGKARPEGDVVFTAYELLDALVNGLVFHSGDDHAKTVTILRDSQPWQYIWVILTEIIIPVVNACTWLVNVIRIEKFLDEADFPDRENGG